MQVIPSFQVQAGQLLGARQIPSPNFNARPVDTEIQLIVIHNISLPPSQFGGGYIEQFFQNQLDWSVHPYFQIIQGMQVSAHLLILRSGEVLQLRLTATAPSYPPSFSFAAIVMKLQRIFDCLMLLLALNSLTF